MAPTDRSILRMHLGDADRPLGPSDIALDDNEAPGEPKKTILLRYLLDGLHFGGISSAIFFLYFFIFGGTKGYLLVGEDEHLKEHLPLPPQGGCWLRPQRAASPGT